MGDLETFLFDPWTIRTFVSITAGAVTGLVAVRLTFHLHNQRDLFESIRGICAELEHDRDQLPRLVKLLRDDMNRQQVDLPIEIPAGTSMEFRYVLQLPASLHTAAFDRLKQSGRLMALPDTIRRDLFSLYDAIDQLNRLHRHRESLHYDNVENVHIVIDTADLDLEPGETATESDLPPETRRQLEDWRRMRRAMAGLNTSMLRLIASISSEASVESLELGPYREGADRNRPTVEPDRGATSGTVTIDHVIRELEQFEQSSFWARFV